MARKGSPSSEQLAVSRDSLARRTLAVLEESLRSGRWGEVLPGERKLSETLQISRMTLRQALAELERRGWITSGRGKRRRILDPTLRETRPGRSIVFLAPVPVHEMEPQLMLLIHHLSESLQRKGLHLEIEARPSCFTRRPERALQAIAAELRPAGWVLFRGNQAAQEWFRKADLPFVILGSTFVHGSPSFGSEHIAIGSHAAGQFLRVGHRHGVIIAPRHETAALTDEELVRGFQRAGFTSRGIFHDRTRRGILQALDKALVMRPRVSAIFTIGGQYSVTLLSALLNHGIAVPKEISLIAMGDDPAFRYLVPAPAHYTFSMEKGARMLFRLICRVVLQGDRSRSRIELLPDFIRGDSLGPCKGCTD